MLLALLVVSVTVGVKSSSVEGGARDGPATWNQSNGVQAGWGTTTRAAQAWRWCAFDRWSRSEAWIRPHHHHQTLQCAAFL